MIEMTIEERVLELEKKVLELEAAQKKFDNFVKRIVEKFDSKAIEWNEQKDSAVLLEVFSIENKRRFIFDSITHELIKFCTEQAREK